VNEFLLPGYDIDELVGFGGSGEVWRARERATGELVALKRVSATTAGAEPTQRLQREAALLATVQHEHVVRLRSVIPTADGLVLVLDYAEGGSLTALLAARGRLSAGEVVTIGAPLAGALADVHARGLVHGDISPGNIVFDGAGKPLLADLGVASLAGEQGVAVGATPGFADPADSAAEGQSRLAAGDVHGLAAVCFAALAGVPPYLDSDPLVAQRLVAQRLRPLAPAAPAGLVAAIESALDPDPAARPDAATLGRALFAACAPAAVRLARPTAPVVEAPTREARPRVAPVEAAPIVSRWGSPSRGRHRWSTRRAVVVRRAVTVAVAVGLLGGAIAVGVGWAGHDHNASASTVVAASAAPSSVAAPSTVAIPSPQASRPVALASSPAAPDWTAVLTSLDSARDAAFADGEASQLDAVYVAGSAVFAADQATLTQLLTSGQRARGLQLRLVSVRAASASPTNVTLAVRDTLPAYDLVGADGAVEHVAGRGERDWIVMLRAQPPDGQWRIASIGAA